MELSSGWSTIGVEIDCLLCHGTWCAVLLYQTANNFVLEAATAVLQAQATLLRHLSGWRCALSRKPKTCLDVLRPLSQHVSGPELSDSDGSEA